jgi:putative membrane protein insertion efficiency factor
LTLRGFRAIRKPRTISQALFLVFLWFAAGSDAGVTASESSMKGPRAGARPLVSTSRKVSTSCVEIAFLGAIGCYQKWVSPIGSGRCGFSPSCSQYARSALQSQGPLVGLMMTGDRLTRCHIWKRPGPDYFLLPTGKLYDPPSNNLLSEK